MFDPDVEMPITQSRTMSDFTIEQLENFRKVMEPTTPFLDALIAEKQAHAKLRAEVEKLRDRKRSLSKTQYQTASDLKNGVFDETFGTMPETHTVEAWEMGARSNQRTATALTLILEADDE